MHRVIGTSPFLRVGIQAEPQEQNKTVTFVTRSAKREL